MIPLLFNIAKRQDEIHHLGRISSKSPTCGAKISNNSYFQLDISELVCDNKNKHNVVTSPSFSQLNVMSVISSSRQILTQQVSNMYILIILMNMIAEVQIKYVLRTFLITSLMITFSIFHIIKLNMCHHGQSCRCSTTVDMLSNVLDI